MIFYYHLTALVLNHFSPVSMSHTYTHTVQYNLSWGVTRKMVPKCNSSLLSPLFCLPQSNTDLSLWFRSHPHTNTPTHTGVPAYMSEHTWCFSYTFYTFMSKCEALCCIISFLCEVYVWGQCELMKMQQELDAHGYSWIKYNNGLWQEERWKIHWVTGKSVPVLLPVMMAIYHSLHINIFMQICIVMLMLQLLTPFLFLLTRISLSQQLVLIRIHWCVNVIVRLPIGSRSCSTFTDSLKCFENKEKF